MGIFEDVKRYYKEQGISATEFRCVHHSDCRRDHHGFTEAREPLIGSEYESGKLPKLVFLSLDPGSSDSDPESRTAEALRLYEEEVCDVHALPKVMHWYRTHELAYNLLKQFDSSITLESVHLYFAHTNSAKCCLNNSGRAKADWRMFHNCRPYIAGELAALQPDVLVTQGDEAKSAIEASYQADVHGDLKDSGHAILQIGTRDVLWIHTYHPRYFGGFNRQRRDSYPVWIGVVGDFISNRPNGSPRGN